MFKALDHPAIVNTDHVASSSYRVSALSINAQRDCAHCALFEAATKTNTKIQAYGCLRRPGQEHEQHFYRLFVQNTFNAHQEAKMLRKMKGKITGWDEDTKMAMMRDLLETFHNRSLTDYELERVIDCQFIFRRLMGQILSRQDFTYIEIDYNPDYLSECASDNWGMWTFTLKLMSTSTARASIEVAKRACLRTRTTLYEKGRDCFRGACLGIRIILYPWRHQSVTSLWAP